MTIIAYKDGEMWADDLLFQGPLIVGRELKITRCKDGSLAGASGDGSACSMFLRWAERGRRGKAPDVFTGENSVGGAIVVTPDGVIHDYTGPVPSHIGADHYAIGSAGDIAIGAMMVGASAKDAVIAACRAYGWPASLQGVNHGGEWFKAGIEEVYAPAHEFRTPSFPTTSNRRRT